MTCRRQVARRAYAGKCFFCPEAAPEALQCHRIVPGAAGGTYAFANTLAVCASCHAKVTAGTLKVFARRTGTGGTYVHCEVGGVERFIRE